MKTTSKIVFIFLFLLASIQISNAGTFTEIGDPQFFDRGLATFNARSEPSILGVFPSGYFRDVPKVADINNDSSMEIVLMKNIIAGYTTTSTVLYVLNQSTISSYTGAYSQLYPSFESGGVPLYDSLILKDLNGDSNADIIIGDSGDPPSPLGLSFLDNTFISFINQSGVTGNVGELNTTSSFNCYTDSFDGGTFCYALASNIYQRLTAWNVSNNKNFALISSSGTGGDTSVMGGCTGNPYTDVCFSSPYNPVVVFDIIPGNYSELIASSLVVRDGSDALYFTIYEVRHNLSALYNYSIAKIIAVDVGNINNTSKGAGEFSAPYNRYLDGYSNLVSNPIVGDLDGDLSYEMVAAIRGTDLGPIPNIYGDRFRFFVVNYDGSTQRTYPTGLSENFPEAKILSNMFTGHFYPDDANLAFCAIGQLSDGTLEMMCGSEKTAGDRTKKWVTKEAMPYTITTNDYFIDKPLMVYSIESNGSNSWDEIVTPWGIMSLDNQASGNNNGYMHLDWATNSLEKSHLTPADVNNDGYDDMIFQTPSNTFVYSDHQGNFGCGQGIGCTYNIVFDPCSPIYGNSSIAIYVTASDPVEGDKICLTS